MSLVAPSLTPSAGADAGDASRRRSSVTTLELLSRLRRAIGLTGMLFSAAAIVLGLMSFAVSIGYDQINDDLRFVRAQRAIGLEIQTAGENLDRIAVGLLGGKLSQRTMTESVTLLVQWENAAKRFFAICPDILPQPNDLTRRVEHLCTEFALFSQRFEPALQKYAETGAVVSEDLYSALLDVSKRTGQTAQAIDSAFTTRYAELVDSHNRFAPAMLVSTVGFLFAGVILIIVLARAATRHHVASQAAIAASVDAQRSRQQLLDAIATLPVGFALYDRDERLVLFNQASSDMTAGGLTPQDVGVRYETLLDRAIEVVQSREPERDFDEVRAANVARFRRRDAVTEERTEAAGRSFRYINSRTADGGTVVIKADITTLKQSEAVALANERKYQSLVNSLADTVFSLDREGSFTYVSDRVVDLLGYRADELLGRSVLEVFHPLDRPLLAGVVTQLRAARGKVEAFTCRLLRKDGGYRLTEIRVAAPEKHANGGGEWAMIGIGRNVEAQHQMERSLHDRMERLNSIVQSTGAFFLLVGRDLRVVMANNGFLEFAGAREEEIVARPFTEIVNCPIEPAVIDAWLAAEPDQELQPLALDGPLVNTRGETRTIRFTVNPVRGDSGRVEHIVLLGVDETDRRRTELELFNASRLATLGEMASGIAHEINQPLAVICLAAEYLLDELRETADATLVGESRPFIDEQCTRIIAQAERAATIIRDLRGFARKPDEASERIDVRIALRTAANMVSEQLRLAGVKIERDVSAECPAIFGHASRLQQVIINLILNARDAILDGTARTGSIVLRARATPLPGQVAIIVEDDGPGIPDHVLPRLFEPFFTTKPTGKGTGLGLSISYQIVRNMGGSIVADNRPEGGARFTITLNAAPEPADEVTQTAA
ncbi:MAG TPA: PAS domain S-box protein [Vineibacter sp.]|nr:PAS domain S-box protein [Vineibacter sp.]